MPIITIITPVYNGRAFIDACLRNVADQNCPDIVHLVMDGGSTDGTVEFVRAKMAEMPWLSLVSEPDKGQSDAMNKGIALARTEYVSFLNVDDYYAPGTLSRAVEIIRGLTEPTFIVGNCNIRDQNDNIIDVNRPTHLSIEHMAMGQDFYQFPYNPSAYFYPRTLHDMVGPYDVNEHYLLDVYFLFAAVQAIRTQYFDEVWGNFRYQTGGKTHDHNASGRQRPALRRAYRKLFLSLPITSQFRVVARTCLWRGATTLRRWRRTAFLRKAG